MVAIFLSLVIPSNVLDTSGDTINIVSTDARMSVGDYISSPIDSLVGISDGNTIKASNTGSPSGAIGLVLLVLAIGGFIGICTRVGLFDSLINSIINSGLSLQNITVLLCIYFVLSATTSGLYESAVVYIPVLINLYKRFNVKPVYAIKVLLLSVSVGYIASPINPFATLIADQIAGNTADLFAFRSLFLLLLTVGLIIYLVIGLRKYDVQKHKADSQEEAKLNPLQVILFLFPYVYMTIGFMPNFWFSTTMTIVTITFIAMGLLIGLISKLSVTECIDELLGGMSGFMIIAVSITLARTVYIILFNSQVIDTIIYNIVQGMSDFSMMLVLILTTLLFLIISYLIQSPSALAMITLPIIAPALDLVGISVSSTVTLFLLAHGLSKMYSMTSPLVIACLDAGDIEYQDYIKAIRPYVAFTLVLGFGLVLTIV